MAGDFEAAGSRLEAVAELRGDLFVEPVKLPRGLRFTGDVHDLRRVALHAEGEFVGGDAGGDFRIAGSLQVHLVQLTQAIQHPAPYVTREAVRVAEIQNGILRVAQFHALIA